MLMKHLGPCTLKNARWCHLFLCTPLPCSCCTSHTCFIALSVLLLLSSFVYRLHELNIATEGTQNERRWWMVFQAAILTLTLLNTIALFFGGTYDLPGFQLEYTFSVLDLTGGPTQNVLPRISILTLLLIYFIGFTAIFLIRRKLFEEIGKLQKSGDRHSHKAIYRSLTAQSLLPLAYMIASVVWLLDVAGIVHSTFLHKLILVLSGIFPLFSPLINLSCIPPYRKFGFSSYI
ncbi:hypothetical protein PMAYCL1PPCAC_14821, partial [Pristionchus mayeri]